MRLVELYPYPWNHQPSGKGLVLWQQANMVKGFVNG